MKSSIKKGFGFGLTSGIITTLGMMIGLNQGTHSTAIVLAGIGVVAITDAFSDSVAIFMADETELQSKSSIWQESLSTFFSKFIVAASFALPVIFMRLENAIVFSVIYGLVLITILSYIIAKNEKKSALKIIAGHLAVTIAAILISGLVGGYAKKI